MTSRLLASEAIERLLAGNQRFAGGRPAYPDQTPARRRELAAGQQPFAAVLGCSDSRLPPELIFDQGLGDLFTVRVAGHFVDQAVQGSLEYAVQHLGVGLIVVLGHSRCGAVQAALAGHDPQGQIASIIAAIQPAVELARLETGDPLDRAVRINVGRAVRQLRAAAPILAPLVEQGSLKILGAHYDLESGVVELLP